MKRQLFILMSIFSLQAHASLSQDTQIQSYLLSTPPAQFNTLIQRMPKGADLHSHLSGAAYPEDLLNYAKSDHFCLRKADMAAYEGNCAEQDSLNYLDQDASIRDQIIDAWSMRHFKMFNKNLGHDHFFSTFGKSSIIVKYHTADVLAEVIKHAADQSVSYLELMITLDQDRSGLLGKAVGPEKDLSRLREKLLAAGMQKIVADMSVTLDQYEQAQQKKLSCDQQVNTPACQVTVRYLYQVLREQPPEMVFGQLLAGFMAQAQDKRIVGINMVQPEDGKISMRDYHLHMLMIAYLHHLFPQAKVSLHAGELSAAFVSAEDLTSHINEAVYIAGANRIGHGVDIATEKHADRLLTDMAKQNVMVEINLTSNDEILGINGKQHPLQLYRQYHVPVALSTDDEGITRSSLTQEFKRAMIEQHTSYHDMKMMTRYSLEYAFVEGKSLWQDIEKEVPVKACASLSKSDADCQRYLSENKKAALQYKLEKDWSRFESEKLAYSMH